MDDDLETIEEAFDAIPPEVQEYIYSDDFEKSMTDMFAACGLSADKQTLFRGSLFGFLAQVEDEEEVLSTINEITDDEAVRQKMKEWVGTNVSQKILPLITAAYILGDNDNEQSVVTATTPIVSNSLSTLSDRLKQASIAAPAKRDYSLNKSSSSDPLISEAPSTPVRTIDPYHEQVDNE